MKTLCSKYVRRVIESLCLTTLLVTAVPGQVLAQPNDGVLRREEKAKISVTATVQAINPEKREVTLKGPKGDEMTLVVGDKVKRLNEVKVGDKVTADYYVVVSGELRPPTDEEKAHPITIIGAEGRAAEHRAPAGAIGRGLKVVTTIVALDLQKETVTLQGPLGDSAAVHAKSVENLKKMRLGDTIVVIYADALVVSLDKAE